MMALASRPLGTLVNRIIRPFRAPLPPGGPIELVNVSAARTVGSTATSPTITPVARSLITSTMRRSALCFVATRKCVLRRHALNVSTGLLPPPAVITTATSNTTSTRAPRMTAK